MKIGKALQIVLARWDMTPYRLAKASGVGQATVGKLINGDRESSTWDLVERLANGFEKLDIAARVTFLGLLILPDDKASPYAVGPLPTLEAMEKPENIAKVLGAAHRRGLLNQEAAEELFEQTALPAEQWLSMDLQQLRAGESAEEA
jgi:transcriptional regulator with XRE-family HTH domain